MIEINYCKVDTRSDKIVADIVYCTIEADQRMFYDRVMGKLRPQQTTAVCIPDSPESRDCQQNNNYNNY